MARHFGNIERVVGNVSDAEKKEILNDRAETFKGQRFEDLLSKEREKTPTELKLIYFANEVTNILRRLNRLGDFEVPPQNIHVIRKEYWPPNSGGAFYNPEYQGIAIREQEVNIVFFTKIIHELIHFKSYNAAQVTASEDPEIREYRNGLVVHARDGRQRYFENLNEAVTEEITKEIVQHMRYPLLEQDIAETKAIQSQYPNATDDSGRPFFNDDTYYARFADNATGKGPVNADTRPGRSRPLEGQEFGYRRERAILHELIMKLFQRNRKQFRSVNEVHELFRNAMMTGNILHLGKLVDRTFGAGTLRRIGELDENIEAQELFVKSL